MEIQPTTKFWVAKPVYKEISILCPVVDYWTVAGDFTPENRFVVSFPQTKTVLTALRLTKETATKLAEAFEKERVSSILEKRPAFYLRILRQIMSTPASVRDSWEMENGLLSDFHKPF